MIIKKFQGATETEAIMYAKEELGKNAIVMNVKTIAPRGFYKLFRKTVVEITAAIDDTKESSNTEASNLNNGFSSHMNEAMNYTKTNTVTHDFNRGFFTNDSDSSLEAQDNMDESAIEMKLNSLQQLIEKQMKEKEVSQSKDEKGETDLVTEKNLEYMRLIYNQLIANDVDEKYANQIVSDFETKMKKETTLDNLLSGVYQKIVLKLGQQKSITLREGQTTYVFFIGPTGVGKTTTIAKIASYFLLKKKVKVGLLTADTYRVAAVEQLRTYANILGIPLNVIYSLDEMEQAKTDFSNCDIVLVDTAGRSHKNQQQKDDISRLIDTVPEEMREVYLVLSSTTKYKDLVKITETYKGITDYGLIFTKLDETSGVGNIYNIKLLTGAPLAYVTSGQNVPDDISTINPQDIAKQLLGGSE